MKNFAFKFVLLIPIINAVATNTTSYFEAGTMNPGTLRAFILLVFSLYFIFSSFPTTKTNRFILSYLIFYFILTLFSSNISSSLYIYLKFFLGIIMFPIAYYFINTEEKLRKLSVFFIVTLFLFIVTVIISNIFKLGTSDYLEESFYFGAGRVNITKIMVLYILMSPIFLLFFAKNKFYFRIVILILILGFAITLLGIKRSVLLTIIAGLFIYFLLKKNKIRLIKITIGLGFFLIISLFIFPNYINLFLNRLEAREDRVEISEETIESEARYNETFVVWEAWKKGSVFHKLFGSELFNDRAFFKTYRMLHTDYMIILNGSGIVGFFLWFYLLYLIIKEKNKYYRYVKHIYFYQELNAIFYMLIAAQLLMSISGTVYAIDLRAVLFMFWGASISTMRTAAIESISKRNTETL